MKLLASIVGTTYRAVLLLACIALIGLPSAWMAHLAWRLVVVGWRLGG